MSIDLNKIIEKDNLKRSDLTKLLALKNQSEIDALKKSALEKKKEIFGDRIYIRGLIELSNVCSKNCYYCGIRKSNDKCERYTLTFDDAKTCIDYANDNNFGSIVIQAGERKDKKFIDFVTKLLKYTSKKSNGNLRVTLSLGEQTNSTYKKWLNVGAHRYLLRVETTNIDLYNKVHPLSHSIETRIKCLENLKNLGYQLGTGVLIGIPGQTEHDLANDIMFFKEIDVDMIGMGPYIPHQNTPLGNSYDDTVFSKDNALEEGLKMISATRLFLPDINIASTTALEALSPNQGLESGFLAGANVFMISLTDYNYKKSYFLYDNKPCSNVDIKSFQNSIDERIKKIGMKVAYGEHGDSEHFRNKNI